MIYSFQKILCFVVFITPGCVAPVLKEKYGNTKIITPYGAIRGILMEFPSAKNIRYVEGYFGLQYASVHRTKLRFSVPDTPKERWPLVKVFKTSPACPQIIHKKKVDRFVADGFEVKLGRLKTLIDKLTEDCLRLNIYVTQRGKIFSLFFIICSSVFD